MHAFTATFKKCSLVAFVAIALFLLPQAAVAQGPLTNGQTHTGAISAAAEIDTWTFTASQNDYIALSVGEVGADSTFYPWIRLRNPNGVEISSGYGPLVGQINVSAPLSGTYTVLVASADTTHVGVGSYRLTLVQAPGAFVVTGGDEGGPMTNGADHQGNLYAGDLDQWSFQANKDDYIALSVGEIVPVGPDPGFYPWIRLVGPTGVVYDSAYGPLVAQINVNAPLTGTYTVIVGSADTYRQATGTYHLLLARIPGGAITVPAGDQGGVMTNGANHAGSLYVGDLDTWTFTASQHDYITLSLGEPTVGEVDPGFYPWIRLVGPTGVLLDSEYGPRVAQIAVNAPLSGTYTVIVGTADTYRQATGNYLLTLAKVPDAVTVPTGDDGGPMTNGANHTGHIYVGDIDQWTFQANKDDYIALSLGEPPFGEVDPGFYPWIRLVGPTGVLLDSAYGPRVAQIDLNAPLTGTYTVIVGTADTYRLAEGNYKLTLAKIPGTVTVPDGDQGGPLATGPIHAGQILVGDLDQWTFQATKDDYIALSVGEPPFGEVDPGFYPWMRLIGPTGVLIDSAYGPRVAQINVNAPLTGTYTVIIGTADTYRLAEGSYQLTLAKAPGGYTVSNGDQGGPMLNTVPYAGSIYVGDLDQWTFHATKNAAVSITITEPPFGEVDPGFYPWIRVIGPTGVGLYSNYGTNSATINFTPTLSGNYTVIVGTADTYRLGAGNYVLSGTGITLPGFTVTPSAGANGTITPNVPQEVNPGGTVSFTLTPSAGFVISGVGGTCGGSLVGQVFTTAAVNASCTVVANFGTKPTMTLDKTSLNFAAVTQGGAIVYQTAPQEVALGQTGGGVVTWTVTPSQSWLKVTPASGTGPAKFTVSVVPPTSAGTLSASIAFTFTGAANNPGPIAVSLDIKTTSNNPFGSIDTPTDHRTGVTGAIPFTGWLLDDIDVVRVMICRFAVSGEVAPLDPNCGGAARIFVGFATFIEGARPDVVAAFPTYPANAKAGWGFMVLTNMLPNQGNGTYVFEIYGQDRDGHTLSMGTRTITCSNATATLPFGAIDTPAQGGTASGNAYINFGWALTQNPKSIPIDGSTIRVLIDGVSIGTVDYNHFRGDIAVLFPGLANSGGAVGFKVLDTTTLTNGLHTISWVVTDSANAVEGIGSRFFNVANTTGSVTAAAVAVEGAAADQRTRADIVALAPRDETAVIGRRGWDLETPWTQYSVGSAGRIVIRGEEVDRFELELGEHDGERYTGYLRVGDDLQALPIGSTLNDGGSFTWAPGVGFVGKYDLVFVRWADGRPSARRDVRVILAPKGSGHVGTQIVIDTPRSQQVAEQPFLVGGWAVDLDASVDTGIDTLHVWAFPAAGGAPVFLGTATYGGLRPDVAAVHGDRFQASGFGLSVQGLAPGTYDLQVFPWSNVTAGFAPPGIVRVTVK